MSYEYFIGYLIIISSLASYFKELKSLFIFIIFNIILTFSALLFFEPILLKTFIFYFSSVLTICAFSFGIFYTKIRNEERLKHSTVSLKEKQSQFVKLFESIPDSIITFTKDGKIINVNKNALSLFQYNEYDFLHVNIDSLFEGIDISNNSSNINFPKTYKSFIQTKNRETVPVEIVLKSLSLSENEESFLMVIKDIRQKIKQEEELSKVKKRLEENLIKEKLNQAKAEFISKISHELRTPLNGIYGFTNLLLKEGLKEQQIKFLEHIKFSSQILKTLIDDILEDTNIQSGNITLKTEKINFQTLLNNVIKNFDSLIKKENIKLNYKIDLPTNIVIEGDSIRVSQILMNLISNAIKHSFKENEVTIDIIGKIKNYNTININLIVTNYGNQIPEESLDEIFKPYVQINSKVTQHHGGTGLGLSIVKNLVQIMKGSIKVESKDKTKFHIILPLAFQLEPFKFGNDNEIKIEDKKKYQTINLKILVAEDNEMNRFLIKTILDNNLYISKIVSNGQEVLDELKTQTYDVVILDIQMPVMDGITCAKNIIEVYGKQKKIYALSADVEIENEKDISDLFVSFIKKPIEEEELIKIIESNG
ncbi:MAG: response regulator [Flavobacteriia bacterium]|nr:response regulator [Flavobacteriia bacterium]